MNELQAPARFLTWVLGIVFALGLVGSLGKITYSMATYAVEAQRHDQMSWGKFSRQLWSAPKQK